MLRSVPFLTLTDTQINGNHQYQRKTKIEWTQPCPRNEMVSHRPTITPIHALMYAKGYLTLSLKIRNYKMVFESCQTSSQNEINILSKKSKRHLFIHEKICRLFCQKRYRFFDIEQNNIKTISTCSILIS